jgi:hypothetical protein
MEVAALSPFYQKIDQLTTLVKTLELEKTETSKIYELLNDINLIVPKLILNNGNNNNNNNQWNYNNNNVKYNLNNNINNNTNNATICRYWKANCCKFKNNCRFAHKKLNANPTNCPFGLHCKYNINGKCDCIKRIQNKNRYLKLINKNNNNKTNSNTITTTTKYKKNNNGLNNNNSTNHEATTTTTINNNNKILNNNILKNNNTTTTIPTTYNNNNNNRNIEL